MIQFYYMDAITAIILGFVEGATEFIPVSSSGHLIIVRQLLGENNVGGLAFDAILQLSASCALLVYFWSDILEILKTIYNFALRRPVENKEKILILAIAIGTIPAIIFGLFLESYMETIFRNTKLISLTLILGSILFWVAERFSREDKDLSFGRGVLIGLFQCLALVPGVSRSGATISGGLIAGLRKDEAVRFSFLLSIPILFGAGLKKLFEIRGDLLGTDFGLSLVFGSITAFVVGLISINFLIKYLKNHSLNVFIWYRIALSIAIFFLF